MRYTLTHTHAHAHAHNAHAQVEMCPRLMLGSGWLWLATTARACCGSLGSTTRRRVRGAELRWTSASAATTAPSPATATSRARTGTACSAPHTRSRCSRRDHLLAHDGVCGNAPEEKLFVFLSLLFPSPIPLSTYLVLVLTGAIGELQQPCSILSFPASLLLLLIALFLFGHQRLLCLFDAFYLFVGKREAVTRRLVGCRGACG